MKTKLMIATLAAAGLVIPATAQARVTRAELRHDARVVHHERHDLARAKAHGNPKRIAAEKRELRRAKQELREDSREMVRKLHRRHHD